MRPARRAQPRPPVESLQHPTANATFCSITRRNRAADVRRKSFAMPTQSAGTAIAALAPELDALAAEAMAEWKVPAVTLAVVQDGETALLKAWGQRDAEAGACGDAADAVLDLLDHQNVYRHGAGAIGRRGTSRLEQNPSATTFPNSACTIRSRPSASPCATCSAIIPACPATTGSGFPAISRAPEMLTALRHLEPARDVRTEFQYNNLAYNVAGLVTERVSGQSYEQFIRTRLTGPLQDAGRLFGRGARRGRRCRCSLSGGTRRRTPAQQILSYPHDGRRRDHHLD